MGCFSAARTLAKSSSANSRHLGHQNEKRVTKAFHRFVGICCVSDFRVAQDGFQLFPLLPGHIPGPAHPLCEQRLDNAERRGFANIVRISFERQPQDADFLAPQSPPARAPLSSEIAGAGLPLIRITSVNKPNS